MIDVPEQFYDIEILLQIICFQNWINENCFEIINNFISILVKHPFQFLLSTVKHNYNEALGNLILTLL